MTVHAIAADIVLELHRLDALRIVPPQQIVELAKVAADYPYNWRKSLPDIVEAWRKAIWLAS